MAGSLQEFAKGRLDIYKVPPQDLVIIPGWNVRDDSEPEVAEHIRRIADTIKATGIQYIPPLTVYMHDGKPTVSDGYCRTRAALLAISEGAEVPYLLVRGEDRHSNDVDRTLSMLHRNEHGLRLTPLKQAKVVKRLLDLGLSEEEVAERAQKSITHIRNLITLLSAPQEVQTMVKNGEVSAKTATEVIRKEGETQGTETLKKAVETAKEQGKQKATPKHLPAGNKRSYDPEKAKEAVAAKAKEMGLVVPLPKPGQEIDFAKHGPTMLKFMKAIRDVPNVARLQELQAQAGPLISGMMK